MPGIIYNKTMKNTIKSHKDFDFDGTKSIAMPAFYVKYRPRRFESGEYGLIASKRNFPTAVKRNRAKRLMRAWLGKCKLPSKYDILLIAKSEILETKIEDGVGQMAKAIKKIKSSKTNKKRPKDEIQKPDPGVLDPKYDILNPEFDEMY